MDENKVIFIDKNRGSISGDMYHAIRTIKDDPTGDKKKLVGAGLGTLALAGAATYLTKNRPQSVIKAMSPVDQIKYLATSGSILGGMAGGALYAHKNRDNNKKYYGMGASALAASALCAVLAKSPSPLHEKLYAGAVYGTATALPVAIAHTGTIGQRIHETRLVDQMTAAGLTPEEIHQALIEHGAINNAHPEFRYIKKPEVLDAMYQSTKTAGANVDKARAMISNYGKNLMGRKKELKALSDEAAEATTRHRIQMVVRNQQFEQGAGTISPSQRKAMTDVAIASLQGLNNTRARVAEQTKQIKSDVLKARVGTGVAAVGLGTAAYALSKDDKEKTASALDCFMKARRKP